MRDPEDEATHPAVREGREEGDEPACGINFEERRGLGAYPEQLHGARRKGAGNHEALQEAAPRHAAGASASLRALVR